MEMTVFAKYRENYFSDEEFHRFQQHLMKKPESGDVIRGTGGLRKVRWAEKGRGKGSRGGVRVIYYRYVEGKQFWLFNVYSKGEMDDMTREQKRIFKSVLAAELRARK